ncbi:MAG: hypothetical protein OSJ69_13960 [Acetatifactor sp.]|nr:hypothetical protein [Acetatifactor sp.]
MEKKYYFRGLGLGIIVTAVIMGIALSDGKKREMTDEEVIARAKELGMIEDSRLLEPSGETGEDIVSEDGQKEEAVKKDAAAEPVKKDIAVAEQKEQNKEEQNKEDKTEASEEDKPVVGTPKEENGPAGRKAEDSPAKDTNEMTKQDEDKSSVTSGETAGSITIVGGDGSYTVAKKLQEAGIVNSADSFDTFLCERGYDKKLRTGTFQIPANASDEQIARIVTGQ